MCKPSEGVVPSPPLVSEPLPIKGLITDLSSDTNALQNQPSGAGALQFSTDVSPSEVVIDQVP